MENQNAVMAGVLTELADYLRRKEYHETAIAEYKESEFADCLGRMVCEDVAIYHRRRNPRIIDIINYATELAKTSIVEARVIQLMIYKIFQDYCTPDEKELLAKIDEPEIEPVRQYQIQGDYIGNGGIKIQNNRNKHKRHGN